MKEKLNTKQGISLIVLVITIIVIIILAVAVILTLSNNNPIENAKYAVSANDEAAYKEEATLEYADWYTKKNLGTLEEEYKDKSAEQYVKDQMRKKGYTEEVLAKITVTDEGEITIDTSNGDELLVVEGVTIPRGFKHVEGTEVATGLVIKNTTDNNEFVWVPVEVEDGKTFAETFVEENSTEHEEPYKTNEYIAEKEEYDAMVASVEKYGGFYIGRYEASETSTGSGIVQSIGNKTPWTNIPWGNSMESLSGGAVGAARSVYPVESAISEGDPVSTLTYGVQWDTTVRWLEKKYENITSDCTGLGNFTKVDKITGETLNTPAMIKTGAPEHPEYALNNIYDLAGNVHEWTMTAYDGTATRIYRGGCYGDIDFLTSVLSATPWRVESGGSTDVGFRIALYIK